MTQSYKKGLLFLAFLMGFIVLMYYSGVGKYFSLEMIQQKSGVLKHAVAENYFWSVIIFMIIYTTLIMATLPVVGPLTLLAGYLFGVLPGFLYSIVSSTLGSMLSFLVIRYALASIMRDRYKERLEPFQINMKQHGYSYLLMLQLLSVVPFVVINTLSALTDVSLKTMLITTFIGSIPLVFIYAWAGQQLGTISSMRDILSPQLLFILMLLALLALAPIVIKKYKKTSGL